MGGPERRRSRAAPTGCFVFRFCGFAADSAAAADDGDDDACAPVEPEPVTPSVDEDPPRTPRRRFLPSVEEDDDDEAAAVPLTAAPRCLDHVCSVDGKSGSWCACSLQGWSDDTGAAAARLAAAPLLTGERGSGRGGSAAWTRRSPGELPVNAPLRRLRRCDGDDEEEDWEAFEESEASLRRASRASVRFCDEANVEHPICGAGGEGAATAACFWQPHEYAEMCLARLALERHVLATGGHVDGESRRGLGLVCEPESRLQRASKIRCTKSAILRLHAAGASAAALARFAQKHSAWATRNALLCARKDADAVEDAWRPDAEAPRGHAARTHVNGHAVVGTPPISLSLSTTEVRARRRAAHGEAPCAAPRRPPWAPWEPPVTRVDSNGPDGLSAMIRNDSLNNVAYNLSAKKDEAPKFSAFSAPRPHRATAAHGAAAAAHGAVAAALGIAPRSANVHYGETPPLRSLAASG